MTKDELTAYIEGYLDCRDTVYSTVSHHGFTSLLTALEKKCSNDLLKKGLEYPSSKICEEYFKNNLNLKLKDIRDYIGVEKHSPLQTSLPMYRIPSPKLQKHLHKNIIEWAKQNNVTREYIAEQSSIGKTAIATHLDKLSNGKSSMVTFTKFLYWWTTKETTATNKSKLSWFNKKQVK